jgi:hypothetical protein
LLCDDNIFFQAAAAAIQPAVTLEDVQNLKVDQLKEALEQRGKQAIGKRKALQEMLRTAIQQTNIDDSTFVCKRWRSVLSGALSYITRSASVFSNDVNYIMPDMWIGGREIAKLLIALADLSTTPSPDPLLDAKDELGVVEWADTFQEKIFNMMTVVNGVPCQLRQRANQVAFTDGGYGFGILRIDVKVSMALEVFLHDLNSNTRIHNAPDKSSGMFAEQSIGGLNVFISPTRPALNSGSFHSFANLAPDDLVVMSVV